MIERPVDNEAELVAEWKALKAMIDAHQDHIKELADQRAALTKKMYNQPGMTTRKLAALLGVSNPLVTGILHRDDPKPGTKLRLTRGRMRSVSPGRPGWPRAARTGGTGIPTGTACR